MTVALCVCVQELDKFIIGHVTPHLRPGEQIMGLGHLRVPPERKRKQLYESEWLAAATNQRLFLLKSKLDSAWSKKKVTAQCDKMEQWEYQDLKKVGYGRPFGLVYSVHKVQRIFLEPHEGGGPHFGKAAKFDIWPNLEKCSGHYRFYKQFGDWLKEQVEAGAFPLTPERRAFLATADERRQAAWAEEMARMREKSEAARQRRLEVLAPILFLEKDAEGQWQSTKPTPFMKGACALAAVALLFLLMALTGPSRHLATSLVACVLALAGAVGCGVFGFRLENEAATGPPQTQPGPAQQAYAQHAQLQHAQPQQAYAQHAPPQHTHVQHVHPQHGYASAPPSYGAHGTVAMQMVPPKQGS